MNNNKYALFIFVSVATAQSQYCQLSRDLKVTSQSGYISNIVTEQTGCGGEDVPWSVQVSITCEYRQVIH